MNIKTRFYQDRKSRMIWSPKDNKIVAEFDQETMQLEIDDPYLIQMLKDRGYRSEQIIVEPEKVQEEVEVLSQRPEQEIEPDPEPEMYSEEIISGDDTPPPKKLQRRKK